MNQDYQRDEELRDRQGGRTFRVGCVLRDTFDGRDDALEPAMTRLMLELTHLPYEAEQRSHPLAQQPAPCEPPSLLRRLASRLHLA